MKTFEAAAGQGGKYSVAELVANACGQNCRRSMGGYRCTGHYAAEMTFENLDGTASPVSLADVSCNECGAPYQKRGF